MMKVDIDTMLSAIRVRLDNADVAENTFTGFCDAVADISSKKHLKQMLLKSLREELKEEAVYATPSIPEQFYRNATTNLPDVPSRSAQPRPTWQEKSDSALTSSEFIDEEFPPRQETDESNGRHIIVRTASGTIPELAPHGQNLERRVHELEDRIKQLKREKQESQRLSRDKISDVKETNRQLEDALGSLQLKDEEAEDLRQQLDCLRQKLSFCEQKVKEKEEQNKEMRVQILELAEKYKQMVQQSEEKLIKMEEKVHQAELKACQAEGRIDKAEKHLIIIHLQEVKLKTTEIYETLNRIKDEMQETNEKLQETNDKMQETNDKMQELNDKVQELNKLQQETNALCEKVVQISNAFVMEETQKHRSQRKRHINDGW